MQTDDAVNDLAELHALLALYAAAAYAKDVDQFMSLYADDARVFDLWGAWEVVGAPAWRKSIAEWFGSLGDDRVVVEFDGVAVSVGGGIAAITAIVRYSAEAASGALVRQMANRLTWVLRPATASEGAGAGAGAGSWQVFHEHTSAPVDSATGTVILER